MERRIAEAIKAKHIAEEKIKEGDLVGAKESASKAKSLHPLLSGLDCLMASIDVNLSGKKLINGEVDWYAVVGVEPTVDSEAIRSGYRRLALALLSDQHKAPGSDGAFKLLSEAWNVLCSQSRKQAYDRRRGFQPRHTPRIPIGLHEFRSLSSSAETENQAYRSSLFSVPPRNKDTFWAMCNSCCIKYEYLTAYRNKSIFCPHCEKPFEAIEVPPPPMDSGGLWDSGKQHSRRAIPSRLLTKPGASCGQSSLFSPVHFVANGARQSASDRHSSSDSSIFAQLSRTSVARPLGVDVNASLMRVRGSSTQLRMPGGKGSNPIQPSQRARSHLHQLQSMQVPVGTAVNLVCFPAKLRNALVGKAKMVIKQNHGGNHFVSGSNVIAEAPLSKKKTEKSIAEEECKNKKVVGESSLPDSANVLPKEMEPNELTMTVPDPDFYNFDADRTEASFKENEVWAAYDDSDGMPRFYAMIHSVVSVKPFKLSISWLNTKSNEELGPMDWIESGFYKTSGNFYIGKRKTNDSLNCFSHKVEWTKGAKAIVQIYPKKGEVWALYRNWSPDWDFTTPDEVVKKYDMVQVLEDFDETRGVTVSPLVKVCGFRTIFRRHPNANSAKTYPKNELFRFSHQVASHLLTGEEAVNAPTGFLELDPAAMPSEILRAFSEEEVTEMENLIMKQKEELEKKAEEDNEKGMVSEEAGNVAEGETNEKKKETHKETNLLVYQRRKKKKNRAT